MSSLRELVDKHRANGLLIDTNLLVLCLVGRTNKRRIEVFKRTRSYTVQDYELLEELIGHFKRLVTTPEVLTETSNLADLSGTEMTVLRSFFRNYVETADETSHSAKLVVTDSAFGRLGFADAAVALASESPMLVLTDDLELSVALTQRGVDTINFNHLRNLD